MFVKNYFISQLKDYYMPNEAFKENIVIRYYTNFDRTYFAAIQNQIYL